jgi:bifunctional ADP-heptose synthase (sugar kinase/adenylyltransferase)
MGAELKPDTKIQDLTALAGYVHTQKNMGHTVVQCHGRFDRLDARELRRLREAKGMGDVLIVTVIPDASCSVASDASVTVVPDAIDTVAPDTSDTVAPDAIASATTDADNCDPSGGQRGGLGGGKSAGTLSADERAELVAIVEAVDFVAISRWPEAADTVRFLAPSVYAQSPDIRAERPHLAPETISAADAAPGRDRNSASVAAPKSDLPEGLGPEAAVFLERLSSRYSPATVLRHVDSLRPLKVALIGESILDEYVYCDALGKSGKEPVLAMRYLSRERHAGGALAIANHLADFCQTIDLFTYLGANDSQEETVRDHLPRNVFPTFIYKSDSPTIIKRRFVDAYSRSKMFAVYDLNDEALGPTEEAALCAAVEARIGDCDLVIVADFGHGLITEPLVELLCEKAPFLAVNTQLNAANMGYHTISKYRRADFVSIHEGEIRLDSRSRNGDLRLLMRNLADQLSCRTVMVTRGKYGSLMYHHHDGFVACPAFATKIVDRVGAGDAVFALASLGAARGVPSDLLSFLGNVVGAQAVTIVGNRASVDRQRLTPALDALLRPFQNQHGAMVA